MTTQNLLELAQALAIAVDTHFMASDHAKNVFKNYLKMIGLDVPKGGEKSAN